MKNVLSLGLGTQSTMLYILSTLGYLPELDFAVFSDTGGEKPSTYDYLNILDNFRIKHNGPPIYIANEKNLFNDLLNNVNSTGQRFASIPAFTDSENGGGMLRRQCTNEYKIAPIDRTIRRLTKEPVNLWIGFSLDEKERMAKPRQKWKTYVYPFLGYYVSRDDYGKLDEVYTYKLERYQVKNLYSSFNMPVPSNSLCFFCPYMSDAQWYDMKKNDPDTFEKACNLDEKIRDSSKKGIKEKVYIHKSMKPLREVDFNPNDNYQIFNCTSGNCDT